MVITNGLAEDYGLTVGDEITLRDDNLKEIKVKIRGMYTHTSDSIYRQICKSLIY